MTLTEVNTEKVPGRISHVYIGYDAENGIDIHSGIVSFEYGRDRDAIWNAPPGAETVDGINLQLPSKFVWKLKFLSDCRQAFFATDVQSAEDDQFAMGAGFSNKLEYFQVVCPIEDASGNPKTRTYTITNGYALRNRTYIGEDNDAIYEYEGEAEDISYSDV